MSYALNYPFEAAHDNTGTKCPGAKRQGGVEVGGNVQQRNVLGRNSKGWNGFGAKRHGTIYTCLLVNICKVDLKIYIQSSKSGFISM